MVTRRTEESARRKTSHRLSQDDWFRARQWFEADVAITLSDVADKYGVSRQAVHRKSKLDGWTKRLSSEELTSRAHALADKRSVDTHIFSVDEKLEEKQDHAKRPEPEFDRAAEKAVDRRAVILERHRTEMNLARKRIYTALQEGNESIDGVRLGKLAAEALKVIQDAERKAWALDASDERPPTVIIERTNG